MMAKFLKDDDERLNVLGSFEVLVISNESDKVIDRNKYNNITFNEVIGNIERKYEKEIEISVLDYGDELRAILTPSEKISNCHYVGIKLK